MSVTVTDNARITQARHYLADYELHHSQPADHEARPAPPPNELGEVTTPGPQEWETEWRRVPPWRPVRNQLDEQRNTTQNGIERGFIRVMFSGVYMMAVGVEHRLLVRHDSDIISAGH